MKEVRIDKWLWATRVFKTRTIATTACKLGRVTIGGMTVKPSTYMNLSGEAVRYWMIKENIDLDHLLVIVDDIALPFGQIRIRPKGADGGHNGLKSINDLLGSQQWARLRFGIGNDFPPGAQVDYVLGYPTPEELAVLPERAKVAVDAIKAFCLSGVTFAMNNYNNK